MSDPDAIHRLLDTLLQAFRDAAALGQHEAAFHALSAAAHAAEGAEDPDQLREIERTSREHLRWMDANDPEHRFGTRASRERGHRSVFEQLAVTARGMRQRIAMDRRRVERG